MGIDKYYEELLSLEGLPVNFRHNDRWVHGTLWLNTNGEIGVVVVEGEQPLFFNVEYYMNHPDEFEIHRVLEFSPVYRHDCTNCTYLGTIVLKEVYDLYYCTQGDTTPLVIARFGDDGPDYYSGLNMKGILPLIIAQEIAEERGLL